MLMHAQEKENKSIGIGNIYKDEGMVGIWY